MKLVNVMFRSIAVLLSLIAAASGVSSQQSTQHARVELLARQTVAAPGTNLRLGVHFFLDPGWHIYWVNPGDSGQPLVLKWQLPPGLSAGEIQWPRPERMQATAQLADYGYHGDVMLPVDVHVPPAAGAGPPVQIGVEAKWLVCREVCIPERAQLHLTLPIAAAEKENPQSAPLFAETEKLLPRPMPRAWKARARSEKDHFVLLLQTGKRISQADFFPLEANQIDNPAPQKLEPLPSGVQITLKKSDLLLKPVHALRGVLVLSEGAYRIEAPVQ